MGGSKDWPIVGKSDPSQLEHASLIKHDIEAITRRAGPSPKGGNGHQIPFAIASKLFDSVLEYIKRSQEQPDMRNVARQIQEIHGVIKASRTPATTSIASSSRTYASIAAGRTSQLLSPPHLPPSITSRASDPSKPPIALPAQREIIIKLNDNELAQGYKRGHSDNPQKEILRILNDALSSSDPIIKSVRVSSARSLKSGDIQVHAATARDAELLKKHTSWAKALGSKAEVQQPSFGIVLHSVPVKSMNVEKIGSVAAQLRAENSGVISDAVIRHVGWLTPPGKDKKVAAAVIEFDAAADANAAIAAQTLAWNGSQCRTEKYNRSCRLRQCFKCYKYGHIGTTCPNNETCGMCGSISHQTKQCDVPASERKCCLCKGQHTPWAAACPVRQKEKDRLKEVWSKSKEDPYWPEVAIPYISPGPSQISTNASSQQPQPQPQQAPAEDSLPFQIVPAKRRRQSNGQTARSRSPTKKDGQKSGRRPLAELSPNEGTLTTMLTPVQVYEDPDVMPLATPQATRAPSGGFTFTVENAENVEAEYQDIDEADMVMGGMDDEDETSALSTQSSQRRSARPKKPTEKAEEGSSDKKKKKNKTAAKDRPSTQ